MLGKTGKSVILLYIQQNMQKNILRRLKSRLPEVFFRNSGRCYHKVPCVVMGFLIAQQIKNLPVMQEMQETQGLIPGPGRSPGGGNGNPLQYSCLKNPMDRGAWWALVQRVSQSRTWLNTEHCAVMMRCWTLV